MARVTPVGFLLLGLFQQLRLVVVVRYLKISSCLLPSVCTFLIDLFLKLLLHDSHKVSVIYN